MVPGMPERNSRPAMPAPRAAKRDVEIERRSTSKDMLAFGADFGKGATQTNDDAGNAAVAHQQIGTDTQAP